jgi:hypothetical protein
MPLTFSAEFWKMFIQFSEEERGCSQKIGGHQEEDPLMVT